MFVSWDISSSIADHPEPHCENSSSAALKSIATIELSSHLLETDRPHQGRWFVHVTACAHVEIPLCSCLSAQYVTCDTKLRDQCKGTPCNRCGSDKANNTGRNVLWCLFFFIIIIRYECPAGCQDATGKVVGTVYYEMVRIYCSQSSFFMLRIPVKHIL